MKIHHFAFQLARAAADVRDSFSKGWRQAWARGDDAGGGSGDASLANPAQQSAWVLRCLQLIAGPVRAMPLRWYDKAGADRQEIMDDDLALYWDRPAAAGSGLLEFGDVVELCLDWINLKGQALIVLDDSWLAAGGIKSAPIIARADRLSPIKRNDELLGWYFMDGSARRTALLPQQVIRPRILNPFCDEEGLSPMQAAQVAAEADHAASLFQRNVAASNGDQGVFVIAKNSTLSAEQQAQIIAQLRQKAAAAKSGNFRPAFLTGDVSIEDPKIKSVDATFISGRMASQHEIFIAFGVPPSMSQVTASYSVGSASDWYRLINDTCIPHAARLASAFKQLERLRTGRNLHCEFDFSAHPVMAEVTMERLKAGTEMFKAGVPWDVVNDKLNLGLPAFTGSDRAWLPLNLQAVDLTGEPAAPVRAIRDVTPAADPLATLRSLIEKGSVHSPCSAHAEGHSCKAGDPARVQKWKVLMAAREPQVKLFRNKLKKALFAARVETLAKIEGTEKALAGIRQRGILDLIFNLADFTASLWSDLKAAHQLTLDLALEQFGEEIGRDPWQLPPERTLNHLRQRENLIRDASREIHDSIKAELEKGLNAGESSAELARRVRAAFNGIEKERAETIALTEVSASYGLARHDSLEAFGIERREWLSAQDDRVRDTHRRIDGTQAALDEPFLVPLKNGGEEPMMHPGDPAASAENVIRCRCVEVAVLD